MTHIIFIIMQKLAGGADIKTWKPRRNAAVGACLSGRQAVFLCNVKHRHNLVLPIPPEAHRRLANFFVEPLARIYFVATDFNRLLKAVFSECSMHGTFNCGVIWPEPTALV